MSPRFFCAGALAVLELPAVVAAFRKAVLPLFVITAVLAPNTVLGIAAPSGTGRFFGIVDDNTLFFSSTSIAEES